MVGRNLAFERYGIELHLLGQFLRSPVCCVMPVSQQQLYLDLSELTEDQIEVGLEAGVCREIVDGKPPNANGAAMTDVVDIFSFSKDWENSQMADITKGRFDFHRGGGKHDPVPAAAYVQIYVKSSVLSWAPDLAISAHLTTEAEIDEFVDDALAELEEIRIDAKKALAAA